jgi:hypothetical protein
MKEVLYIMTEIQNGSSVYRVGNKVADAEKYRLYLCKQNGVARECLLQIAISPEHNGGLERAVYLLKLLGSRAVELEEEYATKKTDPNIFLNYQLGFPEVVDSFICQEQGGRRINVLAFRNVEAVGDMVPLTFITEKKLRVDLRTSAWIMGKLLKLLVFAHSEGIAAGLLTGKNVIIHPKEHYVVIFDWSSALTYPEGIPLEIRRQEISQAAQSIIAVLGGDPETSIFPNDGGEAFGSYTDYLLRLALGDIGNAQKAHADFYELVDNLWKREYYPFTTKPLINGKEKENEEEKEE